MPKVTGAKSLKRTTSPYFKKRTVHKSEYIPFAFRPYSPAIKLDCDFFNQECLTLAKELLGQLVVRLVNGKRISGYIVETECYLGNVDAASHSFNNKQTKRTEPMFMAAGTSYVYTIYGMYYCFNISSKEKGSCVLIRALEPYENLDVMDIFRKARRKNDTKLLSKQLCSGPSKLCQALDITKDNCNKLDLANSSTFWLEKGVSVPHHNIVTTTRIGIESAGPEAVSKPYRFYVLGCPSVSVKNKKDENLLLSVNQNSSS